jgi:SpoVK/Ycf46/Vps4 family AAA+-type ATPase
MATADQIKALIKSHLEGDEERFRAVAIQVAAHAARQGHGQVASEIKALLDEARAKARNGSAHRPIPIATPKGELAGLLAVSYPQTRLADMVLSPEIEVRLQRILREHRGQHKLRAHGLSPRRKLMLVGPPGSGKTMTASALAGELHLPLYVIVLHGLITKYMGETAAKLRLIFDALAEHRGVYLFDEFDAIGGRRSAGNDVGEIRRVLNSFLQFLEQDDSQSVVLAATNHPEALDDALFRRFDDLIEYTLPPTELLETVLRSKLAVFDLSHLDWTLAVEAAQGLSYADITQAAEAAAKEVVLDDSIEIPTRILVAALQERRTYRRPQRG